MSTDVAARHMSKLADSDRVPWWAYAALATFAAATTLFVILTVYNAGVGEGFWFVISIVAVNWVVFGTCFWISRSKPRRRKGSSPKLTA
ncbi:hypothetical protein AHiyo4_39910 [Arthrobacter sp. Hiyo4]|nr:hypothetical protein AHiyo4_39910 [Arthrobacter sp. Hiyo4]